MIRIDQKCISFVYSYAVQCSVREMFFYMLKSDPLKVEKVQLYVACAKLVLASFKLWLYGYWIRFLPYLYPSCTSTRLWIVYSIHNGVVGTLVPPFTTYYHTKKPLLVYRLLPLLWMNHRVLSKFENQVEHLYLSKDLTFKGWFFFVKIAHFKKEDRRKLTPTIRTASFSNVRNKMIDLMVNFNLKIT